jgi:hypothetical protein
MWTATKEIPPLTSVSAYAVVFELCELLDALLEQNKGKALLSSPPLLYFAVTRWPLGSHNASKNRPRILRILLKHGANPCEVFANYTAYERLCELAMRHHFPASNELKTGLLGMVLPFLEAGQDPNTKIRYSRAEGRHKERRGEQCLLHFAASLGDTDLIAALLEHGADVNTVDEAGSTPLDWACDIERVFHFPPQLSEIVDGFLKQPAFSGQHGLLRNYLEAASLLVSKGARFGVPTANADDKFSLPRKPLTRIHIDGLRGRGISTLFPFLGSYMLLYELFFVHP